MPPVRDTLFGDLPLIHWCGDGKSPPWNHFEEARRYWDGGDSSQAAESLRKVLRSPGLESRHYVQAWHFLRQLGEHPSPEMARQLLGVVIEVPLEQGLDLLAAYPDFTARYYNFSGSGVIWERPDASMDDKIGRLLEVAADVVKQIGPWDGPRPGAPAAGQLRLSFLTPGGLCFGQGPFQALAADPMGAKVIQAGTELMQGLIARAPRR